MSAWRRSTSSTRRTRELGAWYTKPVAAAAAAEAAVAAEAAAAADAALALAAEAALPLAAEAALPLAAELAAELVGELAGELPAEAAARHGALAAGARDRLPDCVDKYTSLRPGSTKVTRPMRVLFAALPARGNSCGRRICLQQRAGVLGQARMLTS
jgi:hypothetical protein